MYYFKKLSLLNRQHRLAKQIGKLELKIEKYKLWSFTYYRDKIHYLEAKIEIKENEIEVIDEILEYLQNEKPKPSQKVSNNSFIAAAKNDSGAKIQFPFLTKNDD